MRRNPALYIGLCVVVLHQLALDHAISLAHSGKDAIQLYKEGRYAEARRAFEKTTEATWKDPNAAYYYALSLNAIGRTHDASEVCRGVLKRYPHSEAAKLSKIAIERWSPVAGNTGVLGLKYLHVAGKSPEISTVVPNTPAAQANLMKGDTISEVNGISTEHLDGAQFFNLMTGKPDTSVKLTIRRGESTFERTLTRMSSKQFAREHPDIHKLYPSLEEN